MSASLIKPVILCGGGGTRLWPLSTARLPKQFLGLLSERSMLAQTAERVSDPSRFSAPLAIGAARHAHRLRAELPTAELLLEPAGRNSAPPIAAAALLSDRDELLLVLPSDHHIEDINAFDAAVSRGAKAARNGRLMTFGVKPDHPATGYGYIQATGEAGADILDVIRFVEKPERRAAEAYLHAGDFFWNAGIFLFRAGDILEAFRAHAPDILDGVDRALSDRTLDPALFGAVRAQSIDYAVMERAENISVAPVSMGWSDLGDYDALHRIASGGDPDAVIVSGPAAATNSRRVYVRSDGPRVTVHGVENIAVAAAGGNVLVTRLSDAAGVKDAIAAATDVRLQVSDDPTWRWVGDWLWGSVMPAWSKLAVSPNGRGFIEAMDEAGQPRPDMPRRGRVAPRQLFAFARAKRYGWNPGGAADEMIEAALHFLDSDARSPRGGWAHGFDGAGQVIDERRDLYDHAFVALAGSELAMLGDPRGHALAKEAFALIERLFFDPVHNGWRDIETRPAGKFANPHMHLLEASLAYFEAAHDSAAADRIETICALFEQFIFDTRTGAVIEALNDDWSRDGDGQTEPGHCYEWAYLLTEVERLSGRDTASWARRLVAFTETRGLTGRFARDRIETQSPTFRLWPQLERLRILTHLTLPGKDAVGLLRAIRENYLAPGPAHGWIDKLDGPLSPATDTIPASMLYHLMTGLAPFAPPTRAA